MLILGRVCIVFLGLKWLGYFLRYATVSSFGAALTSLWVPDRDCLGDVWQKFFFRHSTKHCEVFQCHSPPLKVTTPWMLASPGLGTFSFMLLEESRMVSMGQTFGRWAAGQHVMFTAGLMSH